MHLTSKSVPHMLPIGLGIGLGLESIGNKGEQTLTQHQYSLNPKQICPFNWLSLVEFKTVQSCQNSQSIPQQMTSLLFLGN